MKEQAKEVIMPYDNSRSKKEQVTNMFDKIAPFYDFLNHFLSAGIDIIWRKKAIKLIKGRQPKRILDIATGTGDLAIEAAKKIDVEQIIGLDISQNMLDVGNKKLLKKKLSGKIKLVLGDSENLTFANDSFDTVMAAFGVRNFENLEKGLAEMYRVLKPGGQLMILEFSKPTIFPFKQMFNIYFKYILPLIGKIKSKDPKAYKYLYESVQTFPDYEKFANILERLNYKNARWKALSLGICSIYQAEK